MDDHQLRPARLVRRGGVDVQLAEQPAEGEVLVGRDVLVAEEDDEVLGERAVDLVQLAVRQRLGEIDAGDLRADDRRQLVDGDRLVGRDASATWRIRGPALPLSELIGTLPAKSRLPGMVARARASAMPNGKDWERV